MDRCSTVAVIVITAGDGSVIFVIISCILGAAGGDSRSGIDSTRDNPGSIFSNFPPPSSKHSSNIMMSLHCYTMIEIIF